MFHDNDEMVVAAPVVTPEGEPPREVFETALDLAAKTVRDKALQLGWIEP